MKTVSRFLATSTWVLLGAALAQPAIAATLQVRGIDSGRDTTSPSLSIADQPPFGDPLEFRVFYAANASSGVTMDYDGVDPVLESDLVGDAAHLFVVEKSGDLALFVVYKRQAGTQSADATLSATRADFSLADVIVQDAAEDDYAIVSGDLVTSHRILLGGRTDGYVATLSGRFEAVGDGLTFDLTTPGAGTSDLPFTSVQVYTGIDSSGNPIWFEIDSGPFSSTTQRRIELTLLATVPSLEYPVLLLLALVLVLLGESAVLRISPAVWIRGSFENRGTA